jgi:L-amino acid N-acyltransferase YncA
VIRAAREADGAQIAAIWNREVLGTTATTDTAPRGAEAQRAWLAAHTDAYPALVATAEDEVVGFGALAPYSP